jgi:hypothetical protein
MGEDDSAYKKMSAVAAALVAALRSALLCFLVLNDLGVRFAMPLVAADFRIVKTCPFCFPPILLRF